MKTIISNTRLWTIQPHAVQESKKYKIINADQEGIRIFKRLFNSSTFET